MDDDRPKVRQLVAAAPYHYVLWFKEPDAQHPTADYGKDPIIAWALIESDMFSAQVTPVTLDEVYAGDEPCTVLYPDGSVCVVQHRHFDTVEEWLADRIAAHAKVKA